MAASAGSWAIAIMGLDVISLPPMTKTAPQIRAFSNADSAGVLALNADHVTETSAMDAGELAEITSEAFYTGLSGQLDGFCFAMDQGSDYDSPNFHWFAARHQRFVYVDRIIVSSAARGRGLARALYEDLIRAARRAGHEALCCEVNITPPNPASDAFHERLGFRRVGEAAINGGAKTVGYWELKL